MHVAAQRKRLAAGVCRALLIVFLVGCASSRVEAINVELQISISSALLDADGDPLANHSVIYVIGTTATSADLNFTNTTPISAEAVAAHEILLGEIRIDSGFGPGTFFPTSINFVNVGIYSNFYLRFFDYQGSTPVLDDEVPWGISAVVEGVVDEGFGFAEANFSGAQVQYTNTFEVIPEPGTMHLILLAGTLLFLIGGTGAGRKTIAKLADGGPD